MKPHYHVQQGSKRTTVTLDQLLSDLLALKLGVQPNTTEAHAAVRAWLQNALDRANDPGRCMTSQWLTKAVIMEIADTELRRTWYELLDQQLSRE
jgi:hypothetical protein